MSDEVGADRLRELGKQLPYERPDAERREALRSSLLVAATHADPSTAARKRWYLVGGGFAGGALAAAAIAIVVISPRESAVPGESAPVREAHARIDAPSSAKLEHTVTATSTGTDELVRVRAGIVQIAVPSVKRGDRVRTRTADAELEGTGTYEVAVVDDRLERVTVTDGTAHLEIRVAGAHQQVFLAAGQTWRPKVVTADIEISSGTPPATVAEAEPTKVEPKVEPTKVATKVEATKVEPSKVATKVEPTKVATKVEPTKVESTKAATKVEPTKVEPSKVATKVEPSTVAKVEPSKVATKVEPTKVATKPEPTKAATSTPTQTQPTDPTTDIPAHMPAVTTLATKQQPTATEKHFQTGWALLRAGKAREAAVELAAAADAGGNEPLAVDARYFQAVALVRSGGAAEKTAAERVLVAFLDGAPSSLRRGRAALLLGKLLRDRGDIASARAWFESAKADGDPAVAAAARAHLDSLR